ncbi:tRNA pseudouridine synthase A [Candidatus Cyrtobacter comes]|uniref:tRNA pseudouridine synthase A n=1 Tax=Candidatus Cyrtobacter comes TaxID=675776 RepID=A0ABU5L7A6_9RICK|nr:tRNA pseudouridine(38-40) synthase TruA [Candidatus Cyrtobacter comes]MDZ5762016.1 tRNA pseudouridine synthase A [Candidatus Cyrtobacter comes]
MIFRYKAIIEYDGTDFHGWQSQGGLLSVQGIIEQAILYFTKQQSVCLYGAGRTDSKVHALAQVAHFDLEHKVDLYKFQGSLNYFLRKYAVVIISLQEVPCSFHARFSAVRKTYVYKIINRNADLAIYKNKAWLIRGDLNISIMNDAAYLFKGLYDFKYFRYSKCQSKSSIKTIEHVTLQCNKTENQNEIELNFTAISFLHKQVRMMVGAICNAGLGRIRLADIENALTLRTPLPSPLTAPAHGLYLKSVEY